MNIDICYSVDQRDFKRYITQETRDESLVENLYVANEVVVVYSHVDRTVTLECMPTTETVSIDRGIDIWANFETQYSLERREAGIFNIGGAGTIKTGGEEFKVGYKDCLYITKETKEALFISDDTANPAKLYAVSAPAHKACKTTFILAEKATKKPLGVMKTSNKHVISQFIHPDVLEACQLSMGITVFDEGSAWNTMPVHTHERQMGVYMYFEAPENNVVFHMMGEGNKTRHIVMRNEQAAINPSRSVYAGAGTNNYISIWAVDGENQALDDMDVIPTTELR